jgi:cytochrome d ubiquinol oxidase subunit I
VDWPCWRLPWLGSYLSLKDRIEQNRFVLWLVFLSFPLPFIAILTGWYTAEVGRQPWVVYGVLRTAEAMTPFLDGARGVDLACRGSSVHICLSSR